MSSILKALEKVEETRAAKRDGHLVGVSRERQRRSPWILPVCVLSGAAVAALATYGAMGGFSGKKVPAAVQAPPAAAVSAPAAVPVTAPAAPADVTPAAPGASAGGAAKAATVVTPDVKDATAVSTKAASAQAPDTIMPAAGKAVKAVGAPVAAKKKEPVKKEQVVVPKVGVAVAVRPAQAAAAHQSVAPAATPAVAKQPAPLSVQKAAHPAAAQPAAGASSAPKVTGIAWQKDSVSSIAIINGRPVGEGAMVDGARVVEILPDKVKLSGSNGTFEVPLGAGQ